MDQNHMFSPRSLLKDSIAGLIVFLVALPLCLGIALASGDVPLFSGLIAGIVGGLVVGTLSGSHTSVSGPAAGLTAIVATQVANLGSFEAFLLAVFFGGILQIIMGLMKAGALSAFFPSSVIKGLLAAIGVILILKQIPHLVGHDKDPMGESSYNQPDHETPFSELLLLLEGEYHIGAAVIGFGALALLILWGKIKPLRESLVPGPLVVVILGVVVGRLFESLGGIWLVESSHMVEVPVASNPREFIGFLTFPDFSQVLNPAVYVGAVTIAIVASLETLLNLEAVDRLDKKQRHSPPSRELLAQGVGNTVSGLIGGLPVTSVVIRGTVNVNSGSETKLSAIWHGVLLVVCVMFLPTMLNMIPLSSLAAILLVTGFKLASPKLFRQMWKDGINQFLPFIITLVAIVFTDLLIGILIGLGVSLVFILYSNLRRPVDRTVERHVTGDILRIELANQVSFLNRAALERTLREAPAGSHVLLDARRTDYIDPDVMGLIREFRDVVGPAHDIRLSLRGFREEYDIKDEVKFVDYTTRELQDQLTPAKVLQVLHEGNSRFRSGRMLERDFPKQLCEEVVNQHPMAVVISGIHSRIPPELIFDLGLGDILGIRIGGNVVGPKVLGCTEYGCAVAGAKLVVVMGHTGSAIVGAAVNHCCGTAERDIIDRCPHIPPIVEPICESVAEREHGQFVNATNSEKARFVDEISRRNVMTSVRKVQSSEAISKLIDEGKVAVVGAMYDVVTGEIEFFTDDAIGLRSEEAALAISNGRESK